MAEVLEQGTHTPDNLIGGDKKLVTEEVLVASGQDLARGSVLGRVKVSVPAIGTLSGTGNGTCTAVTGGPKTKKGTYTIACVVPPGATGHGGTFRVTNPDGQDIGFFTMPDTAGGTYEFKSDEINFTLTDGATNFDLTSVFTIAVTEGVPDSVAVNGDGNGTMTEIEGRRGLKVGNYVVTCTAAPASTSHGGTFSVVDPDGKIIGTLVLPDTAGGSAVFTHDQITFKITDGSDNFEVGDSFTITISIHPRQVKLLDKNATDGSSVPYAILAEEVDATSAAKMAIAYLEGQFNERQLVFASGTDIEDVRDAMRDVGLIAVPSVAAGAV